MHAWEQIQQTIEYIKLRRMARATETLLQKDTKSTAQTLQRWKYGLCPFLPSRILTHAVEFT